MSGDASGGIPPADRPRSGAVLLGGAAVAEDPHGLYARLRAEHGPVAPIELEPGDLIRIMDAFHHLPQDEMSKILRSVLPNVVEGGLFVLGDKLPKKEAVGIIFQRQGGKFVPIIEIGKIVPYMRIVDDIKLPI